MSGLRIFCATSAVAVAVLAGACGHGVVTDATSLTIPPTDTTKPPTGAIQRASFTVHVSVDAGDQSVANAAGISTAGLVVRLTSSAPSFAPRTLTTDAAGIVKFENLLEGSYQVSVDRTLSASELARLGPDDRDAAVFTGGVGTFLGPPAPASKEVALVANRRGSVMISELFMLNNPLTTNLGYGMGTYTEVYNNSDTTAYLDGMYLARTPLTLHGGWLEFPCDKFNLALREDSTALTLSSLLMQFPGSGRDYPIKPGEAKVIAMDAIDHNAASPNQGQVDLSRAEFEQFASDADTDNPFSANMIILSGGTGIFGRGYPSQQANLAYVLLSASAKGKFKTIQMISTYGTGPSVGQPADASQVPRAVVLDMLSLTGSPSEPGYAVNQAQTWNCIPFLSPVFERAPAPLATTRNAIAISRKTVSRTSDGREVLQRTRTSARDFEYHEPLLRSLRK